MSNPWFRLYSEFAHDPKVQSMSEVMQRRLVMLLCLRCNGDVTLQDEDVAFHWRITDDELAATKALFRQKGFIGDNWNVLNWEKRQFRSDSSRERVAKHRANNKNKSNGDVTLQKRQSNALDTDTDTDNTKAQKPADKPPNFSPRTHLKKLGVTEPAISDWLTLRKTKRAAVTATAIDGIAREAAKAGLSLNAALTMCCERGWQGFQADWVHRQPPNGGGGASIFKGAI